MMKTLRIHRSLKAGTVAALCTAFLALTQTATAQAEQKVRVDIPAQDLSAALTQFGRETGTEIVFAPGTVSEKKAVAVKGEFERGDALKRLLEGSGLTYRVTTQGAIVVEPTQTTAQVDKAGSMRLAQAAASGEAQNGKSAENNASAAADADDNKLQEIVVTAQKRTERLIDVPIAISVLGGQDLDRSTDRSVADALNRVPGVITSMGNVNSRVGGSGGAVTIRGVAPLTGFNTGSSTTAYYLDSIPFGFVRTSLAPDPAAYDLERVEVLRGPQGTLYGLNALNGVVRVLTKEADLNKFEFKARASTSSTQASDTLNYRGDMAVNVPIIDGKLAVRAVVGYQDWGGWIDKPALNRKDANDSQVGNYRLKVNAQPTEQLSIGLSAWLSRSDVSQPPIAADGRTSVSAYEEPSFVDYDAYGLKVGYDFSGFTVNSMTSYIDFKNHSAFDYTPFIPAESVLRSHVDSELLSEEVIVNSNREGPWRWSFGAMYRDAEDVLYQYRSGYLAPTGADASSISKSMAVFGEMTRAFLDGRLELTGGLRYFEDRVRDTERSRSNFINGTIDPVTGLGLSPDQRSRFEKTSPRLVLTWHPASTATLYASYGEGFRSGLNQAPIVRGAAPQYAAAAPDDLKNYEIGAKWSLWDGRLNFETAAFYMDWQGVQQSVQVYVTPTFLSGAIVNAGSASGGGFEFGLSAEPADGLTLAGTFSWNNLTVDRDVVTGAGAVFLPKGIRLNFSPAYTIGTSADYAFPLGSSNLKGRVSAAANYVPGMISGFAISGTVQQSGVEATLMTRASAGIESGDRWTASLYVDNLMNENGVALDSFSRRWDAYLRPRTVGLQLEYRY